MSKYERLRYVFWGTRRDDLFVDLFSFFSKLEIVQFFVDPQLWIRRSVQELEKNRKKRASPFPVSQITC